MRPSQKLKQDFVQWMKSQPCHDCGKTFGWWVMQFDHVGTAKKFKNIGEMMTYSFRRLLEEMMKCELVCANCHADRTYRRFYA